MQAGGDGAGEPPHHAALGVGHGEDHRGILLAVFRPQRIPRRVEHVLATPGRGPLGALALRPARADGLFQIVEDPGTHWRVVRRPEAPALPAWIGRPEHEQRRAVHRQERHVAGDHLGRQATQRLEIVQDVEPTPEGREHEIVVLRLERHVPHLDRGQSAPESCPVLPAVVREERPEFGTGVQQVGVLVVLQHHVHRSSLGEVFGDHPPGATEVRAPGDVRLVVTRFVVVERDVHRVHVVDGRGDAGDERGIGHAAHRLDAAPVLAAVLGHVDQPVIGPHPQQSFLQRRLGEGHDAVPRGGGSVLPHRVHAPNPAHHLEAVAVDLAREIAAHRRPAAAAVVAAERALGREVESRRRMRADDERRVPVPP